ncbi:hypothetical protein E8A44_23095 [Salmonella enterica]|nr:hypothetical protein [Salmonella enterica]
MGRKFKVWLDSGANIHSCYKQEIDIEEDLGISVDLTLYIQTFLLSYDCDNFLRIYSRGERYPSALCG